MDVSANIEVQLNGEPRTIHAGSTLALLLESLALAPSQVAVELNREIVPRADYSATALRQGDAIEIVTFVGGG